MRPILLVDDDLDLLQIYKKIFKLNGFDVLTCDNSYSALEILSSHDISVVISDIIMPKLNGMQLLSRIKSASYNCEVIMLTAEGSISQAVEAVKSGAFSYFIKPANIEELIFSVRKAQELSSVKDENDSLKGRLADLSENRAFIGNSKTAEELRSKARIIGKTDSSVLITGETGTGKEVIANLIHLNSLRKDKPFICVNCGALNENLIESELFGSERGAFTGADRQRKGRIEAADGGTLFFDEIGELSLQMQVKLLRVLQEKKFERVGGTTTISSDFRLLAATNRDLKKEVEENRFRSDLFYRINIIPITIPPLRERKEDIELLANSFITMYSKEMNKKINPLSPEILELFHAYNWPGNIRELKNIAERLVVLSQDGNIGLSDLPDEIRDTKGQTGRDSEEDLRTMMKSYEKKAILKALERNDGNVAKTADDLGIAKKNLYKKLHDYDIDF